MGDGLTQYRSVYCSSYDVCGSLSEWCRWRFLVGNRADGKVNGATAITTAELSKAPAVLCCHLTSLYRRRSSSESMDPATNAAELEQFSGRSSWMISGRIILVFVSSITPLRHWRSIVQMNTWTKCNCSCVWRSTRSRTIRYILRQGWGKLWPASRLLPVDAFKPARDVFLSLCSILCCLQISCVYLLFHKSRYSYTYMIYNFTVGLTLFSYISVPLNISLDGMVDWTYDWKSCRLIGCPACKVYIVCDRLLRTARMC